MRGNGADVGAQYINIDIIQIKDKLNFARFHIVLSFAEVVKTLRSDADRSVWEAWIGSQEIGMTAAVEIFFAQFQTESRVETTLKIDIESKRQFIKDDDYEMRAPLRSDMKMRWFEND